MDPNILIHKLQTLAATLGLKCLIENFLTNRQGFVKFWKHWLPVAGYWLLVTGYRLTITGYWLLITGYWLPVTNQ